MTNIRQLFIHTFTRGHSRSVKAKKNILGTFIIKGGSVAISLISVPLIISYVNPTQYGIWLTLSSVISWVGLFDIGFGNGLRNKFAEVIARGQHHIARIYVSTTYAILSIIIIGILSIFLIINPFLQWSTILSTPPEMNGELKQLALIVFVFFCFHFVLQLLTTVLAANQQHAKTSFLNFIGSLLSLIIIYFLAKNTSGDLVYLGTAIGITPVITLALASGWYFTHDYSKYAPSLNYIKFKYAGGLMNLGIKFFVIQISAVVLFQTSNLIIAHLYNPEEVTAYNIAFRYFSLLPITYGLALAPIWSAFTEAYVKNDYQWIKKIMQKLNYTSLFFAVGGIIMIIISDEVYWLWIGKAVTINKSISIWMGISVILGLLISPYVIFINGIGKIKLQFYCAIFSIIATIPLAILLAKYFQMGTKGVIIATICSNLPSIISIRYQYEKIITKKAAGAWNE